MDDDASRLMARVRDRDADAFEALYDGHHRLVYGLALRMLGDVASAEDVTQAVFMKIWSAPERFKGGNFSGWLICVTRNCCLDVLRARARHHDELPEDIGSRSKTMSVWRVMQSAAHEQCPGECPGHCRYDRSIILRAGERGFATSLVPCDTTIRRYDAMSRSPSRIPPVRLR